MHDMRICLREEISNTRHARPLGWIDCAQASGSQEIVGGVPVPPAAKDTRPEGIPSSLEIAGDFLMPVSINRPDRRYPVNGKSS